MTQRANLPAPRRNDLAAVPAQLAYSGFLRCRKGGRDGRRVRRGKSQWAGAARSERIRAQMLGRNQLKGFDDDVELCRLLAP